MDVSENSGTPKSSILMGFSIINHPFWGTTIFWKHPDILGHLPDAYQVFLQSCPSFIIETFSDSLLWKVYPPLRKVTWLGWTNYHVLTGDTSSKNACFFALNMFVLGRVIGRKFHLTNSQKLGMTSPRVPHLSYEENRVLHVFWWVAFKKYGILIMAWLNVIPRMKWWKCSIISVQESAQNARLIWRYVKSCPEKPAKSHKKTCHVPTICAMVKLVTFWGECSWAHL